MDVKYIGGDVPWTLPFGDHFYSSSQASFPDTHNTNFISTSDLETIARRHDFEPLYSTNETRSQTKLSNSNHNSQWMNAGVLFTDKTIEQDFIGIHQTDFTDSHGHTFCYLCSINQHDHERTKPRDQSQRRKLIPYNNPKALKARSSASDRIHQNSSFNSVSYQFIVRTGTRQNSGTRAQVFLYMYGTENNWTSINLHARTNPNSDGFPSGSIRTFCLKGPEIGQLHHLNVNLVGARSDKEWFLKEIEITNLNTSLTWLCEFNCWLPKKDQEEHYSVKPTRNRQSELSLENLSVYILQIRTGEKAFAGTDSNIQVIIRGSTSETRRLPLTSDRSNLFEQNQLDTFAIVGWDVGDLLEITVESDRSQLAADWDLKEMVMWKILPDNAHKQVQAYFPFNAWVGKQASTLKAKRDPYSAPEHHPRGPTCYQVVVKTGKVVAAGTDANVFLIIYGKNGRTAKHHLDNRLKNDFERGTTSEFNIMDIDVGEIERINIGHDNTGVGSAWFLDSVIIRKKHSTCRSITNIFIQRLEQISKVLYHQSYDQIQKNHKLRISSTKENNRRTAKSKDYDDVGYNRSILRSPISSDKGSYQKTVRWNEQSMGSQDELVAIKPKRKKDDLSQGIEPGHFDHEASWISTHNYIDKKWQIQSIEERNSLNLDKSTRSLLLSDRLTMSSEIKTKIDEKDDDVYEFEANRWLAKDKTDGKLEVMLKPKSMQLSRHSKNELKPKLSPTDRINDTKKKHIPSSASPSDLQHDKYGDEHPKRASASSANLRHDKYDDEHSKRASASSANLRHGKYDDDHSKRSSASSANLRHNKHDDEHSKRLSSSSDIRHDKYDDEYSKRSSASPSDLRHDKYDDEHSKRLSASSDLRHDKYDDAHSKRASTSSSNLRHGKYDDEHSKRLSSSSDLRHDKYDDEHSKRASGSSSDLRHDKYDDEHSKRSSQFDLGSLERSPRSLTPLDRSPRDISKTQNDDYRSSQRSQQNFSTTFKRQEESSMEKYQRSSSRYDNDLNTSSTNERELLERISHKPPYHSRSAATSAIETRPSASYQRSKSSRIDDELTSPLNSHRDLSTKTSSEPSSRPKSAARSPLELSSHKPIRNPVYGSAYGTVPMDDYN